MQKGNSQKIFVAMSGGVDSSVAALLLKNQGYDTVGVFMRCFNVDGCAERDAEDARRVAEVLGIPFYVWDFEKEYKERVVNYMVEGYKAGITPNPDVMCNREIKFGIFYDKAMAAGADFVATGHYVRRIETNGGISLAIARDQNKDQSYFLWTLDAAHIARCLFPIGDLLKPDVRALARAAKLPTADKKDSQGICFLGDVRIEDFLRNYIDGREGAIVDAAGKTIGTHRGAEFYTIGQRHLGVSYRVPSVTSAPHYIAAKDIRANTVTVVEGSDNPALFRTSIPLREIRFAHRGAFPKFEKLRVRARVRYRQPLSAATLRKEGTAWRLEFDKPQKFVAPGQSAVMYTAEGEMLGGGLIAGD